MKTQYFQGETISVRQPREDGDTAAWLELNGQRLNLADADGVWSGDFASSALSGSVPFRVFVERAGCVLVVEAGSIFVAPAISTHRQRAEAIQRALDAWASTPYGSITIGSITVSDKNINDLRAELATELSAAEREEQGLPTTGGRVRIMRWRFN